MAEMGRPTKYHEEYVDQVRKLAARGMTMEDIADFFQVHIDTLYAWGEAHPTFSEAVKEGRLEHDNGCVENALLSRAKGCWVPEEKVFFNPADPTNPTIISTKRYYPPDPKSMELWLRNRKTAEWNKDKEKANEATDKLANAVSEWVVKSVTKQGDKGE